jgi:hypothetical protein
MLKFCLNMNRKPEGTLCSLCHNSDGRLLVHGMHTSSSHSFFTGYTLPTFWNRQYW